MSNREEMEKTLVELGKAQEASDLRKDYLMRLADIEIDYLRNLSHLVSAAYRNAEKDPRKDITSKARITAVNAVGQEHPIMRAIYGKERDNGNL